MVLAHFHVGHNIAGYLPESDVYLTASAEDALAVLIEDLEQGVESVAQGLDYPDAESAEYRDSDLPFAEATLEELQHIARTPASYLDSSDGLIALVLFVEHRHDGQPWQVIDALGDVHIRDDGTINRAVDEDGVIDLDTARELLVGADTTHRWEATTAQYLGATIRDMLPEGLLPDPELDTTSSASRQHHIDTGQYLRAGEVVES